MNNVGNHHSLPSSENSNVQAEFPNTFKRKHVNDWKCLCPRRYVLVLMIFLLFMIEAWRNLNIAFTLAHVIIFEEEIHYSSIQHWTLSELDNFKTGATVAEVLAQMPGALLIFIYSSHKFLLLSVIASSFFHMLTPVALNHHSISLLFVLISQSVFAAPTYIAALAIWKDWAPPAERTRLMLMSISGIFLGAVAAVLYPLIFEYVTTHLSYYLSGIAGLIWALFWFNVTSDTPQNDPKISEEELIYIENNIPSDQLLKIQIKDVPWKSILLSKPVLVLCLIYFKVSWTLDTIIVVGTIFAFHLGEKYNPLYFFTPFVISVAIIIPSCAILVDFLIKKFSGKTLLIRKLFLCVGFFLQCFFLLGTLAASELTEVIFFMLSSSIFAASAAGFITIPMDLSPRYVSIIAGIIFTFFNLGIICHTYFMDETLFSFTSILWLFLIDGCLSALSILFFILWGDAEEQPWSLTFQTHRRTNDYMSYPKPEDEDNLNLVT